VDVERLAPGRARRIGAADVRPTPGSTSTSSRSALTDPRRAARLRR
jgi:hypothetical protein